MRNVFRDSRGALWLGTDGQGIVRLKDREVVRYTVEQGLVSDFIRAFCEDRDGALWIGTDGGLSRFQNGTFQNFRIEDGLAYGSVRALLLDRGGSLWVATDGGLSRMRAGSFISDPLLDQFRGQKVWAIHGRQHGQALVGLSAACSW